MVQRNIGRNRQGAPENMIISVWLIDW